MKKLLLGVPTVLLYWIFFGAAWVYCLFFGTKKDRKEIAEVMKVVFYEMIVK